MRPRTAAVIAAAILLTAELALGQSLATDRQVLAPGTWRARTGQAVALASEVRMGGAGASLQAWADDRVGSASHPILISGTPALNTLVAPGLYGGDFTSAPDRPTGAVADALLVTVDTTRSWRGQALIQRGWATVWTRRLRSACADPCTAPDWHAWIRHDLATGLTQAQTQAQIDARTADLRAFEAGLRRRLSIADVSVRIAISGAAVRLPGSPALPAQGGDTEIVALVDDGVEHRVSLADLLDVDAASQAATLTTSDSVSWVDGGTTFRLGREAGNFLFAADAIDQYRLRLWRDEIDVQPWARRGTDLVPGSALAADQRLPAPAAGQALVWQAGGVLGNHALGTGGGLSQAQVDARVVAGTQTWARADPSGRIPESYLPADLDDVLDAFDQAGWSTEGAVAAEDAQIARVRAAALPTLVQARGYSYSGGRFDAVGPNVAPGWLAVRVPAALWPAVAADRLRLVATYDPDDPADLGQVALSSGWTLLGTSADTSTYRYYAQRFPGLPGAPHVVQIYEPFSLDLSRVHVTVPYEDVAGGPQVTTVRDRGALVGLTVTSSGRTQLTSLRGLSYTLPASSSGEVRAEVVVALALGSDSQLSLSAEEVTTSATLSGWTYLSSLRALADWVPGGVTAGHRLAATPVYRGATRIGRYELWLGHDSADALGYSVRYVGASGSHSFSLGTTLTMMVWEAS